jgi:hypothetical protein
MQQQGGTLPDPPVMGGPLILVPVPNAEYFICQPTWSKIFLPTLTHLFIVSEQPFQYFKNNSPQCSRWLLATSSNKVELKGKWAHQDK